MSLRLPRRRPRCQLYQCDRRPTHMAIWTGNARHTLYVCGHCASYLVAGLPTIVNSDTGHLYSPQVARITSAWLDHMERNRP